MMHHQKSFLKQRLTGGCLSLLVTCAIFLANIPAHSQDKKQTKGADDDVIKINSNLVSLDVIVKDKKGNYCLAAVRLPQAARLDSAGPGRHS